MVVMKIDDNELMIKITINQLIKFIASMKIQILMKIENVAENVI